MIKLVLALNRMDYVYWCEDHDIDPVDRSMKYVRDNQDLRGLGQPVEIEVTERFWERRDAVHLHADAVFIQERNKNLPDPGPTRT